MKNSTKIWLNIVVAMIMLGGIGLLIVYLPCPSDSQFTFFKIVLALAAAAFSGILIGFVRLSTTLKQNALRAGGGFAIFILVLKYTPAIVNTSDKCSPVLSYTFFLRSPGNASIPDLKGHMSMLIGSVIHDGKINEDGSVYFKDLPTTFLKEKVTIELKSQGWWFDNKHSVVLDTTLNDNRMVLMISQDESLCCIEGRILDSDDIHKPVAGASIFIADTSLTSDANGKFNIRIPSNRRKQKQTVAVTAKGYNSYTTEIPADNKEPFPIYLTVKK